MTRFKQNPHSFSKEDFGHRQTSTGKFDFERSDAIPTDRKRGIQNVLCRASKNIFVNRNKQFLKWSPIFINTLWILFKMNERLLNNKRIISFVFKSSKGPRNKIKWDIFEPTYLCNYWKRRGNSQLRVAASVRSIFSLNEMQHCFPKLDL